MNLREQLFFKQATTGVDKALGDLVKKYAPKKGRRFFCDDITYEIGIPEYDGEYFKFEISSKIPGEKFSKEDTLKKYFTTVNKIISKKKSNISLVEMENIVHGTNKKNVEKTRDYVKVSYQYKFEELYDEKKIEKDITKISKDSAALKKIPHIPGIATLGGRLILIGIYENAQNVCTDKIEALIAANKTTQMDLKLSVD